MVKHSFDDARLNLFRKQAKDAWLKLGSLAYKVERATPFFQSGTCKEEFANMMTALCSIRVEGATCIIAAATCKVTVATSMALAVSGKVGGVVFVLAFHGMNVTGPTGKITGLTWLAIRRTLKIICPGCQACWSCI